MLDRLARIDWDALDHAYGAASDAPAALLALASPEADERASGHGYLDIAILHQGSICSATPRVIPFLLELAANERVGDRHELLLFLCRVSKSVCYHGDPDEDTLVAPDDDSEGAWWREEMRHARECAVELGSGWRVCQPLLGCPEPALRAAAGRLAAWLVRLARRCSGEVGGRVDVSEVVLQLRHRITQEDEPRVQAALVAELGEAAAEETCLRADLQAWLSDSLSYPARYAAAVALLELNEPPTAGLVRALIAAALHWDAMGDVPTGTADALFEGNRPYLIHRLRELLQQTKEPILSTLQGALAAEDGAVRREAARALGDVLAPCCELWERGRPAATIAAPADPMTAQAIETLRGATLDSKPAVRARAAEALLGLGYGGPEDVAALAAVLETDDADACRTAVAALGKAGPAAAPAVPSLIALLRRELEQVDFADEYRPPIHLAQGLRQVRRALELPRRSLVETLGYIGAAAAPAVPWLARLVDDPASWGTSLAMEALRRIGPAAPDAPVMIDVVRSHPSEVVRHEALEGLAQFGPQASGVVEALSQVMLADKELRVRREAAFTLAQMGETARSALPALRRKYRRAAREERVSVASAMAQIAPSGDGMLLLIALLGEEPYLSTWAVNDLGRQGVAAVAAVPAILEHMAVGDARFRMAAAAALGRIGPKAASMALPVLVDQLSHSDPQVRLGTARALARMGAPLECWRPSLVDLLEDEHPRVQTGAAKILWACGERPTRALDVVLAVLHGSEPYGQGQAAEALVALGPDGAEAVSRLRQLLDVRDFDSMAHVAVYAAAALWSIGDRSSEAFRVMTEALFDSHECSAASEVLGRLGPAAARAIPALVAAIEGRPGQFGQSRGQRDEARRALERIRGGGASS